MKIAVSLRTVLLAAGLAAGGLMPAAAQQAQDRVLARVDGVEIRESDLALAEADIGASLPASTPEARRDALLTYLIDVNIMANAANAKRLDRSAGFARRAEFARKKALMEALLDQEAKDAASEEAMKKLYADSMKRLTPEDEVRARHILVETEDQARKIIAALKGGGDFAALAKQHSRDPGAADGGDLGYFTQSQMVPEFAEAAFKLKKGEVSPPVKTKFGWHVIKIEDRRTRPVPTFEEVKGQLEAFLLRRAHTATVAQAREAAKVERLTPPAAAPKN